MSDAPLPSSFDGDTDFFEENRWQKFTRRLKEEPLIPFGVALTCWALFSASRSIRKGDGARTNQMFRYRLYAQSFTLVAMVGGSYYYNSDRLRRKEFNDLIKQKKAKEKKDAWIRELEARDLEDREWREKLGKVRDAQREEQEREALEEMKRREGRSDDGRGVLDAVKGKMREAKEKEVALQAKEQAGTQGKTMDAVKEAVLQMPDMTPKDTSKEDGPGRIWGEAGGGLFGWKHIRNWWNKSEDDRPEDK